MLVLTRKEGQRVFIGDDIAVSIEFVSGKSVRIGFEAPDSVSIDREEVREKKRSVDKKMDVADWVKKEIDLLEKEGE